MMKFCHTKFFLNIVERFQCNDGGFGLPNKTLDLRHFFLSDYIYLSIIGEIFLLLLTEASPLYDIVLNTHFLTFSDCFVSL